MNDSDSLPSNRALDEAAAEWLFEREEGFTPERAQAFADWCERNPQHARAVTRMERTLALLNEGPTVRAPLEARIANMESAVSARPNRRLVTFPHLAWITGLAALLVLGVTTWRGAFRSTPVGENYVTNAAMQRSLAMPDGSVIDINVDSELTVEFTARERRISLRKGEAHFQVAHDTARPFVVTSGDVSVRAVGTAFDVRLASKTVEVLVVEGKVQFARGEGRSALPVTNASPSLVAGERVQVSRSDPKADIRIDKIDTPTMQAMLTWQNPLTSFTEVPLREVVVRFNRRNPTQLVLEDADLGERKIGGTLALDQVDAFLRLLEQDRDIVVDRRADGRIGLRRMR